MRLFKKIISFILRIGISVILLIFIFSRVDEKNLVAIMKNADKNLLLLGLFISFVPYLLCFFRWNMLLKAVKIYLPSSRIISAFAGGVFFNVFLPSTIGGDLVRSVDLATYTKRPREIVATVLLDRLSGYTGLVIVAILALLFGWKLITDKSVMIYVGIITALLIIILLALFNTFFYSKINAFLNSFYRFLPQGRNQNKKYYLPQILEKIGKSLKNLHQEVHIFRNNKKIIFYNLILSIIVQLASPIAFYLIGLSLGVNIDIMYYFVFSPLIGAIIMLPISISGLGLRDATTIFFFAKAGVGRDLAFAMSLMSFLFILVCSGLGGLIYVLTIHHRRIQYLKSPPIQPPMH